MVKYISSVLLAAFLSTTAAAAPAFPVQLIKDAKTVLVVSAVEPTLVGTKTGLFNLPNSKRDNNWATETPEVDISGALLEAMRAQANRELKFVSGKDVDLVIKRETKESEIKKLKPKLETLCRESGVELILLVHTTKTNDFIENRREYEGLAGVGHFYSRRQGAFIVLQATLFDSRTGTFAESAVVKQVRALPHIEWHLTWAEYTVEEKRAFLRILNLLLSESSAELLSYAGLTNKWDPSSKPKPGKFIVGFPPKPFILAADRIEILEGISLPQAREMLRTAFTQREWKIVSDTEQAISATYGDDEEDTACTATFNGRQIDLSAETHETKKDGKRVKIKVDDGLLEDLKLATAELFLKAPASDSGI